MQPVRERIVHPSEKQQGGQAMRAILVLLVIVVIVAIAAVSLGYVHVTQTQTAALPKISVQGGQAPAFNVETANVSVGTENHVVQTPTVNVQKPQ
jgi:flagellar basal body-associated protein FliL